MTPDDKGNFLAGCLLEFIIEGDLPKFNVALMHEWVGQFWAHRTAAIKDSIGLTEAFERLVVLGCFVDEGEGWYTLREGLPYRCVCGLGSECKICSGTRIGWYG